MEGLTLIDWPTLSWSYFLRIRRQGISSYHGDLILTSMNVDILSETVMVLRGIYIVLQHWNGNIVRMTALSVTGDVEGKLQRPKWRPGAVLSPWRPFCFGEALNVKQRGLGRLSYHEVLCFFMDRIVTTIAFSSVMSLHDIQGWF